MILTHNDYSKAIKSKLKEACDGEFSSYLLDPKLTSLRTICEIIADRELSKVDEKTLRLFFNVAKEDSLKKGIQKFDIDRLKPIQFFIKREIYNAGIEYLEILAIMVDFKPRPLGNFIKNGYSEKRLEEKDLIEENIVESNNESSGNSKKKIGLGILILLGLFIVGYSIKQNAFPEKQCMVWKEDHYEEVDCENEVNSFYNLSKEVKNKEALSLKKIDVCDTTTFFVNDKPVVWYGKSHGNHDFFNQDGTHPITGKDLKPVTDYIIKKHVKPCK